MSKKRLSDIQNKYKLANIIESLNGIDIIAVSKTDMDWLVNQAEYSVSQNEKIYKLVDFLQECAMDLALEKLGHHIVDTAIHVITKQDERIKELESDNFALMESLRFQDEDLKQQNDRYREALEFYADDKVWALYNRQGNTEISLDGGETARKALEDE